MCWRGEKNCTYSYMYTLRKGKVEVLASGHFFFLVGKTKNIIGRKGSGRIS